MNFRFVRGGVYKNKESLPGSGLGCQKWLQLMPGYVLTAGGDNCVWSSCFNCSIKNCKPPFCEDWLVMLDEEIIEID